MKKIKEKKYRLPRKLKKQMKTFDAIFNENPLSYDDFIDYFKSLNGLDGLDLSGAIDVYLPPLDILKSIQHPIFKTHI